MLDHIGLRTAQFDTLVAFYKAVLAPLGYGLVMEFPGAAGFGRDTPVFAIGQADAASNVHLAFSGKTRAEVDAFHAAALAHGGKDNGAPGLRDFAPNYYAAFVIDPDGNNIEVVCHTPA
jgi:catechol 2,3-dioxygenase-like lactoylglutathione lyase family enzyme